MGNLSESVDTMVTGGEVSLGNTGSTSDLASVDLLPQWVSRFEEAEMPSDDHLTATEDGSYHCPYQICISRRGFPRKALLRHLRMHIKPVKCPLCSYTGTEQGDVRRHVETAHRVWAKERWRVQEPVACEFCPRTFTRRDNYVRHWKRKHA
ncbi:hypothetical protein BDV26DRAFT_149477 [Aspergillus bertholletiae]|uniref:C2H2-type domain-containing protein n=1 Tax=Aspergillus bertholletiae TaxID=1226010 RepID=A0A5N7AMH4_9EURO|nr:hypothetical protein BDV26DRAFT_149477 [Aspergillus bertholletiae]